MAVILAKKMKMSRLYEGKKTIPVTLFEAPPCAVVYVKTAEKEGYNAVQIGYGSAKRQSAAMKGHLKELGPFAKLKEFRADRTTYDSLQRADKITVSSFSEGGRVDISGISKGKGFQGTVKRHGFSGGPKSHGQKDRLRAPGSIGPTTPQHVRKGTRMAGRMGGRRVTIKNLKIVKIDPEKHILIVQGSVPGALGSVVEIKTSGRPAR